MAHTPRSDDKNRKEQLPGARAEALRFAAEKLKDEASKPNASEATKKQASDAASAAKKATDAAK